MLIGLLLAAAALTFWVKHHGGKGNAHPDAMFVEVEKVKSAAIPLSLSAVGTLAAAHNIQIAPETAGQITKVLFQDGKFVTQGTPLIQLNDAIYKAKHDSIQADLNFSRSTYSKIEVLAKRGIISKQDLEKADADLKEKQAAFDESTALLSNMLLVAPFDGVTGKAMVSPGDYVSTGQALVSLTDTHHLRVEYSVAEKYFSLLKSGQTVIITTSALPGKEFKGHVAFISPTVNTENRTVSVYADVPNDNQILSAGLFVTVAQDLGLKDQALLVNPMSLVGTIDGHQIFKVVNGKAQAVTVEVGQRTKDSVEILKGVTEGDTIIVAGQQKIRDGEAVQTKI